MLQYIRAELLIILSRANSRYKEIKTIMINSQKIVKMKIIVIVAFNNRTFGIGNAGKIPWHIPEDLRRFSKITRYHTVIMGRGTFESIGSVPLPDRFNIVVTRDVTEDCTFAGAKKAAACCDSDSCEGSLVFVKPSTLDNVPTVISSGDIFVIGGEELYKKYVGVADTIYATVVEGDFECDRFFPVGRLGEYYVDEAGPMLTCEKSGTKYRYITYKKHKRACAGESEYINLVKDILSKGEARPDRTEVGTLALFGKQLRFDISESVPFLTTKQLAWRSVIKELLWFLRGSTDSKELEAEGVGIWAPNTSREFLDKRGLTHYREGDMGPLYSHALRHFGEPYKGCDASKSDTLVSGGFDQFTELIRGIKEDPYSRRHLMTTFNPAVVKECVLMPCHGIAIQFFVSGANVESGESGTDLSCHVYCRSSDTFLGLPFNIASYAVLTYLVAKLCGKKPRDLIVSTGDTHIYANHVAQIKEQITRSPLPFPHLVVSDSVMNKPIEKITIEDFAITGYVCWPGIKAPMAV